MKIFKVKFQVRAYCNGVYSFLPGHLTVPAETEEEAIKKVYKCQLDYFNTESVREINLND